MMDNMTRERIKANMTLEQMLTVMAEGNPGALTFLIGMLTESPAAFLDILFLDSMGIRGTKLYMLWNDCCQKDMGKFEETLIAFRMGKFTRQEIHENLSQVTAQPFI